MEDYHKIKCYSTHIDSQQNLQWTDMCKTLPRVQNNKKAQRLFGHESNTVRMFISNIEHSEDLFISFVHISSIFTWALIFCRWSENGVILPQDSFLIMFPLIFFFLIFLCLLSSATVSETPRHVYSICNLHFCKSTWCFVLEAGF